MKRISSCASSVLLLTILASVLVTQPTQAQATWIVDASGGGQFRTIADAVTAASAGDLIVCRKGVYTGFTSTKGVTILGETGASILTSQAKPLEIRSIAKTEHFALCNFRVTTNPLSATPVLIAIDACAGTVALEAINTAPSPSFVAYDVEVTKSSAVSVSESLFAVGLRIVDAKIAITGSQVRGKNAPFRPFTGLVAVNSTVDLTHSELLGGSSSVFPNPMPAAVVSNSVLRCRGTSRMQIAGGSAASSQAAALTGSNASSLYLDPRIIIKGAVTGFKTERRSQMASLLVTAALIAKTSTVFLGAMPRDVVAAYFSLPKQALAIPGVGDLWLTPQPLILLGAGIADQKGELSFALSHTRDSRLRGFGLAFQGLRLSLGKLELTNPVFQVLR